MPRYLYKIIRYNPKTRIRFEIATTTDRSHALEMGRLVKGRVKRQPFEFNPGRSELLLYGTTIADFREGLQ